MVKKNKLLIGCLSLLLVLSVGYALFSETITINGTATAKGNFDIEVSCLTTVPEEIINYNDYDSNGYKNELCTVDSDVVNYSVQFDYPGARKYIAVKFTNVGSIDAAFDLNGFDSIERKVNEYDFETDELISSQTCSDKCIALTINGDMFLQKGDGDIVNIYDIDEEYALDFAGKDTVILKPSNSIYVIYVSGWDDTQKYNKEGLYYSAFSTIKVPFQQYND